jgi:uncharacterized protein
MSFDPKAAVRRDASSAAGDGAGDDGRPDGPPQPPHPTETADILPYVVPMFAYVALGGLESYLPQVGSQPSPTWYPVAYAARVLVVAAIAWYYRATWKDFRPFPTIGNLVLAVLIGLVVVVLWVGLDGRYPSLPLMGKRAEFDPTRLTRASRWFFYAVRMIGLVLLVPLIEELFWRSFLIRWLIDQDFRRVPVGKVTPMSAGVTSLLFALAHPEWLPAFLTGLLWAWLLHQTRSLSACLVSHAVANLALGVYVIQTGHWQFW